MSGSDVDRNLLFGVLALQMDFISRDALITAMNAWAIEKSKALGQILLEQRAITAEDYRALTRLVQRHVEKHRGDVHKSLVALRSQGVVPRELLKFPDADVRASLAPAASPSLLKSAEWPTVRQPRTGDSNKRFEILRPHASGGLGEVCLARDNELNREVALKRIHDQHADDPQSCARFLLEAEITGGLEHPGIVPVYAMGSDGDNRPFYAMRFVRGETLKDAIERFHSNGKHSDSARRIELRQLLGRFLAVCNTMEYAHSRGVIHRDLKPSNIMLDKYGETLVVDWGLAKALGKRVPDTELDEATLLPSSKVGSSTTLPGAAIGTPAFMSPEQADGQLDDIGPTSDVYSLGATLYMLLTGKEPFDGDKLGVVLTKVKKGKFVPPRERSPQVPPALSAICMKAMSLQPVDRYESSAELAHDLERWLADEPVSAYPDPFTTRAARWIRRNRALAAGTAALAAALLVGLSVGTIVLGKANAEIRQANGKLTTANSELAAANVKIGQANLEIQQANDTVKQEAAEKERQRGEAIFQRDESIRRLYVAQMSAASHAWEQRTAGRTLELLESQTPEHTNGVDLRGWEWHHLWRLTHSEVRQVRFATIHIALMPDGEQMLTGGWDGKLTIRGIDGDSELRAFPGHKDRIAAISLSGDGKLAATACVNGTVKLWDTSDWHTLREFPGAKRLRYGLALSRDGKRLAIASDRVNVYATSDGQLLATVDTIGRNETPVRFTSDGTRLLTSVSAEVERVKLWNLDTSEIIRSFEGQKSGVRSLALTSDDRLLAAGCQDGRVVAWELETGREAFRTAAHEAVVTELDFSADDSRLVSASDDTTVKVWDAVSGNLVHAFGGHSQPVCGAHFLRDGETVLSNSWDNTLRYWDASSGQEQWTTNDLEPHVMTAEFSADGRFLAVSTPSHTRVWDASNGLLYWQIAETEGSRAKPSMEDVAKMIAFDPQGRFLAVGTRDGDIRFREIESGRVLRSWRAHEGGVTSIAISPDGSILSTGGYDRKHRLWNTEDGREIHSRKGNQHSVRKSMFSPDGKTLLTFGDSLWAEVRMMDVATRKTLHSSHPEVDPYCAAFSPDGRQVVMGGRGPSLYWFDASTMELTDKHAATAGVTFALAFSPDGRRLASCGSEQTLKIWDVQTQSELQTLKLGRDDVNTVAFSPDGTRLAAASSDGTLKVWDARPLTPELRTEFLAAAIANKALWQAQSDQDLAERIEKAHAPEDVLKRALELAQTCRKTRSANP